ncbi:RNA polymerase sigma-70 factor [Porifericola rhodea]|uniref:RNA polymerase sigma-70 factor n=1 Tax=Porifericola rhodea TaxID=930972 RepID=UPI002666843F|nr:RNA polymerase sigma-70 factor [Porifericola rhodea]WKN30938.1 RNA polymerase sigma-70 factor [Porifericola rhodea]
MSDNSLPEWNDKDLCILLSRDKRAAFNEIYRRHWSKVFYSTYKILKDKELSKDITQEIFTSLWQKRHSNQIDNLTSYLYGMARNYAFRYLRDGRVAQFHLDRMQHVQIINQTEEAVNFNQLQELYEQSLTTLPERCREVFHLSRNENLSVKEIATRMGISPKTVENQITKAIKHLRLAFKEVVTILTFLLFA